MAKTVADQFAETLAAAGVRRVYGIVGDSLNGLTDALRRQGGSNGCMSGTRWRPSRSGRRGALIGQLALCAGSCGPGSLHLINGLLIVTDSDRRSATR